MVIIGCAVTILVEVSWSLAAFSFAHLRYPFPCTKTDLGLGSQSSPSPPKPFLSWPGVVSALFWHLGTLGARLVSLVLYSSFYSYFGVVVLLLHWITSAFAIVLFHYFVDSATGNDVCGWNRICLSFFPVFPRTSKVVMGTQSQDSSEMISGPSADSHTTLQSNTAIVRHRCRAFAKYALISLVYCFDYVETAAQATNSAWFLVVFYGIMLTENALLTGIWYRHRASMSLSAAYALWFDPGVLWAVFVAFFVGLVFLVVHQYCFNLSRVPDEDHSDRRVGSHAGSHVVKGNDGALRCRLPFASFWKSGFRAKHPVIEGAVDELRNGARYPTKQPSLYQPGDRSGERNVGGTVERPRSGRSVLEVSSCVAGGDTSTVAADSLDRHRNQTLNSSGFSTIERDAAVGWAGEHGGGGDNPTDVPPGVHCGGHLSSVETAPSACYSRDWKRSRSLPSSNPKRDGSGRLEAQSQDKVMTPQSSSQYNESANAVPHVSKRSCETHISPTISGLGNLSAGLQPPMSRPSLQDAAYSGAIAGLFVARGRGHVDLDSSSSTDMDGETCSGLNFSSKSANIPPTSPLETSFYSGRRSLGSASGASERRKTGASSRASVKSRRANRSLEETIF